MPAIRAPRTPLSASLLVHACALLAIAVGCSRAGKEEVGVVEPPSATLNRGPEIEPDILETRPIDEQEAVIVRPVLEAIAAWDCDGFDGDNEDPVVMIECDAQVTGTNTDIGVGGGAGGVFGGRRGNGPRRPSLQDGGSEDPLAHLRPASAGSSTESYDALDENPFRGVAESPLSTFSIDVDTASYSLVRRFLERGALPPKGAVRIEEMVNYFPYDYAPPTGPEPFAVHAAVASAPWNPAHRLVRIALKGRVVHDAERPGANLVFLVDVSGSMQGPDRLPLVQASLRLLAERLDARDRVALVAYAGASGLVLPPTRGDGTAAITDAVDRLSAGGSTNGGAGIELAYRVAAENFVKGGINRVILATDGDFNVGVTSRSSLQDLAAEKAKDGVFLTVLGFGRGNTKDDTMETLADRGNGNYAYVDSLAEARKVLVEQMGGTLQTIAKDVKIQVEFNPARVAGYRLLGYENRMLAARDFKDDARDAGEIGAGHCVTAFYEVVPAGADLPGAEIDPLRYRERPRLSPEGEASGELLTVKLRWKEPDGEVSTPASFPLVDEGAAFDVAEADFRFAAAVAGFGMILRDSKYRGSATLGGLREIAAGALGDDPGGHRAAFLGLVEGAGKAGTGTR